MTDRVTRPVTPFVEIVTTSATDRVSLVRHTDAGKLVVDDGRVVFQLGATKDAGPTRILLDPDADLYGYLARTNPADLRSVFEVHLKEEQHGLLKTSMRGLTVVTPWRQNRSIPHWPEVVQAVSTSEPLSAACLPPFVSEVHYTLSGDGTSVERMEDPGVPLVAVLPLHRPEGVEMLPQLLHSMGSGRLPVREVRLRIDPRAYQVRDRRAPFCSEVAEAVATASGANTGHLAKELAFRERMMHPGSCRHLRPDPYFVTWLFRGHPSRGLVPVATRFPVPRRASRRELLRSAPESEHERLVAYLDLLETTGSRLQALEERELFAVSVHYLPNPDLPLFPSHGGIVRLEGDGYVPLV